MLIQTLQGDCREILKTLPDNSVNCCVTSPPYYGLRDYGTAEWEGGFTDCEHNTGGSQQVPQTKHKAAAISIISGGNRGGGKTCVKCGALRVDGQIGLEATVNDYVRALVEVFSEVKRVLRKDGCFWLNLGDSYIGYKGEKLNNTGKRGTGEFSPIPKGRPGLMPATPQSEGLGQKQLIGVPWRVAFALQEDGWILRSDIIWHKPNAMPESVTDRPTKAHEYIFLFSKSPRYYYDFEAIKEPAARPGESKPLAVKNQGILMYHETDPN
jgi:DNA modification methylase